MTEKEEIIDFTKIRKEKIINEIKRCIKEDCDFYLEHNEVIELLEIIEEGL